jgi:hypothetical protein
MQRWVEISFDCLPLRSVGRLDIPLDASPKYQALCERIKAAMEKHGTLNTFYLYNAECVFHLTNQPQIGMLQFSFEGTVLTDAEDRHTQSSDLRVELRRETCNWLIEPVVKWFHESVSHAVQAEFDRYIEAGDLQRAHERMEKLRAQVDAQGGFLGMYL